LHQALQRHHLAAGAAHIQFVDVADFVAELRLVFDLHLMRRFGAASAER
jgi:hypothetical protein